LRKPSAYLWRGLNWPNRISLVRILGVAPFVVLLLNQQQYPAARYVAAGIFVLMGLSDAIDGYLARRRGQVSRLGKILDPLADKILIVCAVILLASQRASVPGVPLPDWVVVCVVGKDLWVVIGFMIVFLLTGQVRIQPTRTGKAATTAQFIMVAMVLFAPEFNRLGGSAGTWLATAAGWMVMAICLLAVISYSRLGLAFLSEAGNGSAGRGPCEEGGPSEGGRS